MVVFRQNWLYSGKRCCVPGKLVVFRQIGCIRAKLFYSGKVIVCRQKLLCSGKNGCIRDKWLFFDKVAVFDVSGCIRVK